MSEKDIPKIEEKCSEISTKNDEELLEMDRECEERDETCFESWGDLDLYLERCDDCVELEEDYVQTDENIQIVQDFLEEVNVEQHETFIENNIKHNDQECLQNDENVEGVQDYLDEYLESLVNLDKDQDCTWKDEHYIEQGDVRLESEERDERELENLDHDEESIDHGLEDTEHEEENLNHEEEDVDHNEESTVHELEYAEHEKDDEESEVEFANGGSISEQDHACDNIPPCCPFFSFGCGCDNVPLNSLQDHLNEESSQHISILLQTVNNLQNEVSRLQTSISDSITVNNERMNRLENEMVRLKSENEELRSRLLGSVPQERVSQELDSHTSLLSTLSQRIDSFSLKYEHKYFEYIWRVPNFKSLVDAAIVDDSKRLVSKAFYTSRNGYKIQMILYPNGIDQGKGRYISLFYQILKDKFDELLSWPFKYNVELRLLDQDGSNDHILNIFFDPSDAEMMESYSRPLNDGVHMHGSQNFISRQDMNRLHSLRKNDTLFLKFCAKPVNFRD